MKQGLGRLLERVRDEGERWKREKKDRDRDREKREERREKLAMR